MTAGDEIALNMSHITKTFGDTKVLDDVNLEVRRGEIHAICGENGAGKSTLMNVLSGVLPYGSYEGTIRYEGTTCTFRTIRDSEAAGIGFIHQELALVDTLSVAENLFLGNERASRGVIDWGATELAAGDHLREVGLDIPAWTPVSELGIGQQQLVEIAKALSKDVRLLILDEPTAALNDADSARLLDLMRGLRAKGITMVLISHKLSEVVSIADRVTVIRDGKTVTTAPLHGEGAIGEDDIVRLMVGRKLTNRFPEHVPRIGGEALRLSHWTVYHSTDPTRKAVDDVSLVLRRGEVVGLAGLVGSGRTELAMSLFGRMWGTGVTGTVYKDGAEISTATVSRAIDAGIAYVTEDRRGLGLNLIQGVKTNTTAVALDKVSAYKVVDDSAEEHVALRYKRKLMISADSIESPVGTLSGGNQQKVVLAKWMFSEPDVLILDEPTRGIDVGAKYEIYQVIFGLAEEGKAILVISSELPEILGICDRIYTMCEGRVTGELGRAEATQERLMQRMTAVRGAVAASGGGG